MINESGFIIHKKQKLIDKNALNLSRKLKPVIFLTDEELLNIQVGSVFIFDCEVYRNFFFIAFKHVESGKYVTFEQSPDYILKSSKLRWMLYRYLLVGFNIIDYDLPIIEYALRGATCSQIKDASDFIIKGKNKAYKFEQEYKIKVGKYNIIDLIEVAPLQGSLKLYAGRLHCQRMQDLPFDEAHDLSKEEAAIVRPYGCNDLDNTELLYNELKPELTLREAMSHEYGIDLRSKSDAQLAEAVINSELQKITGKYPKKPFFVEGQQVQYKIPDFICFQTPQLNKILQQIKSAVFNLDKTGKPSWPKGLGEKVKASKKSSEDESWAIFARIGKAVYKVGMGGLHSQEENIAHEANEDIIIADNDVESFYPRIILNQGLFPPHLGKAFLQVYNYLVEKRLHAKAESAKCKKAGDKEGASKWKKIADSLKIVINGSFGKLGNKYSTIYAPQLMLQVTITGQLVLLMLIEALELAGIEIISGNTDGIVAKYNKKEHEKVRAIIAAWEAHTKFKTEETNYVGIYNRDVNNYLAAKINENGEIDEIKVKGIYSERGSALNSILSKNPETLICSDAVQAFIRYGKPIEETILNCKDFRRFLSVKNVKYGGEKNGIYLGKVVRWYYAKAEPGYIAYVGSGNKVAKTDGAKPCMDLPEQFPEDLDFKWYIKEATKMLYDCGKFKKAKSLSLFF
jgi:hypothetical protein